jgi:hypothetical protein
MEKMTDKEKFIETAQSYVGCIGYDVCVREIGFNYVDHWCAYLMSLIYKKLGYVGKYIVPNPPKDVIGGAGDIPRYSDGKYGTWFKKGEKIPQAGDLFFLRYEDYPSKDKYFCDHVGLIKNISGNVLTTIEGNVDGINGNWARTSTCKNKTRYLNDYSMYAFYRPFWKSEKSTATSSKKEIEIYQVNSSKIVDYFVKVTASDGLNIRQGAGTNYNPPLGIIPYNTVVKVTRWTSGGAYKWGLIEYDGIKGWIALDYTEKINLDKLAKDVIQGKYGNGETRKEKLGILYDDVQKRVNEIYRK